MDPRKLFDRIFDSEGDIQGRLFLLMTVPALFGLLFMFIVEVIIGISPFEMALLGGSFLFFTLITMFAVRTNKLRAGADAVAFFSVFVVVPLVFFTGGGIYGGAPLWFVFCMVFVSMVVPGKSRYFFQTGCALVAVACYVVSFRNPSIVTVRADKIVYHDSLISLLLVGVLISILASFEIAVYRAESRRSRAQREEIDQLIKAQNQFFSNMSHEIRTPINTIIGLNEMILREEHIPDEVAEDAVNIQAASRLLLHLINDILDMSKIESGKMELVEDNYDVGAMLSDVVGMLWVRAKEKGLEFHVDVDPAIPAELYGDEVRVKQVLINLLTNAVKYTREGSVTLSVQGQRRDDGTALMTYSVSDTGMGIKKENIPHLFSAFRRVDEDKNRYIEGTGLGLSIVKQLVDLMGGSVTVNSVYTQGSTFLIELPQKITSDRNLGEIDFEMRHAMNHRARYARSFEAPGARVLVVDDDAANRLVVEKLLRETKVAIDTAESGRDALKKTYETQYHVILMDHMMPEMDGVECLRAIRAQVGGLCRASKIVALTANAGSRERELYTKEGFDGYLVKPVSGEELERELRRMLPEDLVSEFGEDVTLAERLGSALRQKQQKKLPVAITTESVCDLPKHELEQRAIAVIPYHVRTGEGVFLDGVETETRGVLEYMAEQRGEARVEAPGVEEYEAFFAKQLLRANNIIHIALSGKVGRGYAVAAGARQAFGNAVVYDGAQISSGLGLLVLAADDMARSGMSAERILKELEAMKPRIHTSFIVESAEHLARAGRIGHTFGRIASAFMLRPVLAVRNGKLAVRGVLTGTRRHSRRRYIAAALRAGQEIDASRLIVAHAGLNDAELREIAEEAKRRVPFEQIVFQKVSPAIAVSCGPGTFGLAFQTLDREKRE